MSRSLYNFDWPIKKFPPGQDRRNPKKSRWSGMSYNDKRQWLIDNGQATDWDSAGELLKQHHAAVREYRTLKNARENKEKCE